MFKEKVEFLYFERNSKGYMKIEQRGLDICWMVLFGLLRSCLVGGFQLVG